MSETTDIAARQLIKDLASTMLELGNVTRKIHRDLCCAQTESMALQARGAGIIEKMARNLCNLDQRLRELANRVANLEEHKP